MTWIAVKNTEPVREVEQKYDSQAWPVAGDSELRLDCYSSLFYDWKPTDSEWEKAAKPLLLKLRELSNAVPAPSSTAPEG